MNVIGNGPSLPPIGECFAILAINSDTGAEGVMAAGSERLGMLPMMGGDLEKLRLFYPIAKQMAAEHGFQFKVVKFDRRTDITQECEAKYG